MSTITSSLFLRITRCRNSFWKSFNVIWAKTHRARQYRQHVLISPELSNLIELYIKFFGSNRLKILGSLCVAANSCDMVQPLLEKYSTGCFVDLALMTIKCPATFNTLRLLEWMLYKTIKQSLPFSASFKFLADLRASYFTTRHHVGASCPSISIDKGLFFS